MKIAYIGTADGLAETLVERLVQEGNEVYLLSDKELSRKSGPRSLHRFYRAPRKGESFEDLVRSIAPDCVIFAGSSYLPTLQDDEADEDVTRLARTLRAVSDMPSVRFVLLSSTEVYGATEGLADESAGRNAASERGIRFIREEDLLEIYRKQRALDAVILRASQLYTDRPKEGNGDFLSRSFTDAVQAKSPLVADVFQPLHVADLADAVKRVLNAGGQSVYNVSGSTELSARRLHELICREEALSEHPVQWERAAGFVLADSTLIRQELGWGDMRNLEKQLQAGEISFERIPVSAQREKKRILPKAVRQLIENFLIFAVFFALDYFSGSQNLLAQVNWMMIYVILVSLSYNIYQSALAAVLASAAYLFTRNVGIADLGTFQLYAGSVLHIMEFVFLGLMVSYTVNSLREEVRRLRRDQSLLEEEYEDLKAINSENVLIKNEYEERLLTSKTGFPKLYDLVSRLMVQEPDRILMETMQVISELIRTDTVAVYQGQEGSPWLRLVGALSDEAAMEGKTWNLFRFPHIYDAVAQGEIYQGKLGSDDPALVLPIACENGPQAVVLIKRLPFESETLYHINLLKTLTLLLKDAMEKALQYEVLSREEIYVADTDILKPEAFRSQVLLAQEKAEKRLAEYSVVELVHTGSVEEVAAAIGKELRVTDRLGIDRAGRLLALLNNTDSGGLEHLQKRLAAYAVEVRPVSVAPTAV